MKKTSVFFLFLTFFIIHRAQNSPTSSEFKAQIIGGDNQLAQVLQTQLNIPKTILNTNFNQNLVYIPGHIIYPDFFSFSELILFYFFD